MGAKVSFKVVKQSDYSDNPPAQNDGQLIFVCPDEESGTGTLYLDFYGNRYQFTSSGSVEGMLRYVGELQTNGFKPADSSTWKDKESGEVKPLSKYDVVVVGTKEYMHNGAKLVEIGDEESPTWNT